MISRFRLFTMALLVILLGIILAVSGNCLLYSVYHNDCKLYCDEYGDVAEKPHDCPDNCRAQNEALLGNKMVDIGMALIWGGIGLAILCKCGEELSMTMHPDKIVVKMINKPPRFWPMEKGKK